MDDERWEEFSRERLGGFPVPEDVRVLATAQWEGRGHCFERFGITLLEPGARHPLTDIDYLSEEERADPEIAANCAAAERMTHYLKAVAQDEDGNFYGYWLHPRQHLDRQPPPVVKVDTEWTYATLGGRTLSEACLYDVAFEDDELFAELAEELARLHIAVPARSRRDLEVPSADPDPEDVHEQLFRARRRELGLPD
ncbi:hypothetical protein ACI2LJ_00770 [Streptomyces sp. NPDC088090]|uniref:hypothetical protein n=1 Tax=Streptomyces sp. NPDC088090 TaxID=3365822 RepID=UPI003851751D